MNERRYLAVSIKHTEYRWKFGEPCVLWGYRTENNEKRSFGGYTTYPNHAELYSLEDWEKSSYYSSEIMKLDEPVRMEPKFCKKWKGYDTVLVDYEEYCGYCIMCCLPINNPEE